MGQQQFYRKTLESEAEDTWSAAAEMKRRYGETGPSGLPPVEIDDNKIIIGCSTETLSRDNLVMLELHRVSDNGEKYTLNCAFIGIAGTGKSYDAANFYLDNLTGRFGEKGIIVDPQREWMAHRDPASDHAEELDEFFGSLKVPGLKRQGYKMVSMSPAKLPYESDYKFRILYTDIIPILQHEPDEAVRLVAELININKNDELYMDLLMACLKEKHKSWADFRKNIKDYAAKYNTVSGRILRKLRFAVQNKVITDREDQGVDIYQLVNENQVVVYECPLKSSNEGGYLEVPTNAMMKIQLLKVIYAMEDYNMRHLRNSPIKEEWLYILFDEVDQFVPAEGESTTTDFVIGTFTKRRKAGIDPGVIIQEVSTTKEALFPQCKIVSTSRLTAGNASILRSRKMPKDTLDYMGTVPTKVMTNLGTEPAIRMYIDEDNNFKECVPIPGCSDNMKR